MGEPALDSESPATLLRSRVEAARAIAAVGLSVEDYLALEESTGLRHEYRDGVAHAMAGGTLGHSAVAGNIYGELFIRLQGQPCQPFNSDLRLSTGDARHYPDVMVVCPPPKLDPSVAHTILNPRIIIEVLSPSTESLDRGFKWFHYQQIPELTDYLLVSLRPQAVEHFTRQSDGRWLYQTLSDADTLRLASINCSVPVGAFFAGLEVWGASAEGGPIEAWPS